MSRPQTHVAAATGGKDFSSIQDKIKAQNGTTGSQIRDLIASAQDKFNTANDFISDVETVAAPWDVSKDAVADLLAPMKDMVTILDHVGDLHPYLKVIAGVAKIVIQMELDRRDNDKQIAVVYFTMNSMLFLLSDLDPVFDQDGHIQESLMERLGKICTTVNDFGSFCEVYYRHGSFMKTLKSKGYKTKIAGYSQGFADHKKELHLLLSAQSSLTVRDIKTNVENIMLLLKEQSAKEESMDRLVVSMGGFEAVIGDDDKLDELAARFGEKLDLVTKHNLRMDLDEVLGSNLDAFSNKVKLSMEQMQAAIYASQETLLFRVDQSTADINQQLGFSTSAIINKLEEGPHQSIEDDEVKTVWKEMQARTSVETHVFLDAMYNHYKGVFDDYQRSTGEEHPDAWTLYFFSKAYFRPAIGDGMDEDSGGFISLSEVNRFLRSKPREMNCSNVAWIAFWAVGPYKTDVEYLRKIRVLRARLKHAPEKVLLKNKNRVTHLSSIVPLLKLIEVYDDVLPSLGEVEEDHKEYAALEKLRLRWRDLESKQIMNNLETLKYQLRGLDYVSLVLGGRRLENHVMALVYILLRRNMDIVKLARTRVVAVREFEDMRDTWDCVFDAFGRRLGVLWEVWRQQRLDLESQVQYYCRGLFRGWHERNRARAQASYAVFLADSDDNYEVSVADDADLEEDTLTPMRTKPQNLLRYSVPPGPEDESGLLHDVRSDWEPKAVTKQKAKDELKGTIEGIATEGQEAKFDIANLSSQLATIQDVLDRLWQKSINPGDTDSEAVFAMLPTPRISFKMSIPETYDRPTETIHLQEATDALQAAKQSVTDYSNEQSTAESTAGNILAAASWIVKDLPTLAYLYPALEVSANLFKAIIELETNRDAHDVKIALAYLCIYDAVYQLYAFEDCPIDDKFEGSFLEALRELGDAANSFGSACDSYYRLRNAGRTTQADRFVSDRLPMFINQFANHKERLHALLEEQTDLEKLKFDLQIEDVMQFFS